MTNETNFYRPLKFEQTPEQLNKVKAYPVNLECDKKGVHIINRDATQEKLMKQRYKEAENFINEITLMGFFGRLIRLPKLCSKFLDKQKDKYKPF